MSRVMIQEGHLFLTERQIKLLGKGKRVIIQRNGIKTVIRRTLRDAKERKIQRTIAKLKARLRALRGTA